MEEALKIIKGEIIRSLLELKNNEWHAVSLTIDFPPYINKGYAGSQIFNDFQGNRVKAVLFGDQQFQNKIYDFIYKINRDGSYNQIVFSGQRDKLDEAEISVSFNQAIEDNFQNNLPKSKRGKTIPWWKNPEETKDMA